MTDECEHTGNAGMTLAEWDEWSNGLADLLPDQYDDDIAQEALIVNAVGDMAATITRVRSLADAVLRLQPSDPDTGDRGVSWLALLEALDGGL